MTTEQQIHTVDEFGYNHVQMDGYHCPGFFVEKYVNEARERFELREGDIVIATYPKCGTTWMQQIVLTLLHGGDKTKVKYPMQQAPWIEWTVSNQERGIDLNGVPMSVDALNQWDGAIKDAEAVPGRRAFKTHCVRSMCPWIGGTDAFDGKRKCIVVGRNPKDALCSMYHHTKDGGPAFQYSGDFHHFATKLFTKGQCESGCFWEWYAKWAEVAESNPNVLFITFEEMKADPVESVRRIGNFLEVPLDDEIVRNVVGASAFDAMKKKFEENDKQRAAEGIAVKKNHIRKGGVGTWREELKGDTLAEFEAAHQELTAKNGLKVAWDFGEDDQE
mmetsp:Transcript_10122/g.22409  ORF Transcript_10122/g.22409 Transcript_10122/m.22409 type:complete len:332 (-) Transcript_10122:161-1156(-)|eukprot:CAMPEP_0206460176 /NCGR_PEP_ID=MMETSP0324_2-20121206/24610_1 /ASSEMBLY_ACC=CAM_ASM_000836 /TAXON_ID=2866 /ORGANISM="Crypthecodinium cohnii, Strain Seligo" /LENGTH=331 /DNA_ID=CAMNT_0053931857 /DNA_START=132 /DNA_END=1127 /DNA_ORIENTATION=+